MSFSMDAFDACALVVADRGYLLSSCILAISQMFVFCYGFRARMAEEDRSFKGKVR